MTYPAVEIFLNELMSIFHMTGVTICQPPLLQQMLLTKSQSIKGEKE